MNREEWLQKASERIADLLSFKADVDAPEVQVSTGFPSSRGLANTKRSIGECWGVREDGNNIVHIFISPLLKEAVEVLGVLVHEMIHAVDNCTSGHKGAFVTMARAVGLEKPWTATVPGVELLDRLEVIAQELGEYPHQQLIPLGKAKKKQTTRMIKLVTDSCDCTVRTTKKHLETPGSFKCPHGTEMIVEDTTSD